MTKLKTIKIEIKVEAELTFPAEEVNVEPLAITALSMTAHRMLCGVAGLVVKRTDVEKAE